MTILKNFAACRSCALFNGGNCMINNTPTVETNYCSNYRRTLYVCDSCGRGLLSGINISGTHIYCADCLTNLGTCATCQKSCAFNNYNGPLQKIVMIQQRQGNMVMQTQGKNPEVIKQTCYNCPCFRNNSICLRETAGTCENYEGDK